MPRCPVCKTPFQVEASTSLPFCSERCRTLDLGRWLDECYRVPIESEDSEVSEDAEKTDASDD